MDSIISESITIVYKFVIASMIFSYAFWIPREKLSLKIGLVLTVLFWSVGWKYSVLKPEIFSTLYAEMSFAFGYLVIYYVSVRTIKPPKKTLIPMFVFMVIGSFLTTFNNIKENPFMFLMLIISLQILIKISLIYQTKKSNMSKNFKWIYKHFWYVSILNNIFHLYYLNNLEKWKEFIYIRKGWEVSVTLLSLYAIYTYYKEKRVT